MKSLFTLISMVAISTVIFADEKDDNAIKGLTDAAPSQVVISLHTLLDAQKKYRDQKVIIAAYFVTHMEGPWICAENGDWRKRLVTTLSVTNIGDANFKVTPAMRSRLVAKFGEAGVNKDLPEYVKGSAALGAAGGYENGLPALIEGTFRVGDYKLSNGVLLKDHPYIVLAELCEVEPNNPQWNAAQLKGEQSGTGQPATRSQSKSEDSDKPQPEAEGRSR